MKKNNILLIIVWLVLTLSWVSAEYRIYDNVEDFEANKWAVCEQATDSCNDYSLENWKITEWTERYCENYKEEWTCTNFKDNVMTTKALPITITAIPVTTSENINLFWWDKDEHGCIWSAGYSWSETKKECIRSWEEKKLSKNDESFYNSIKNRLGNNYQVAVNKTTIKYIKKLYKYSDIKKERINNKLINLLDINISKLLLQYPQDIALPENINNIYLTLELFKFELMQLNF